MSVIWSKVWFDLWGNKVRTLLAVVSIAAGVFAIGAVFDMVDQLLSGMDRAHQAVADLATAPESATAPGSSGEPILEIAGPREERIVLHGSYMNIPSMGQIIPKLAETHKVYALELQGHGRTTDIDRPITYQNLADDVAAFMNAVGLQKADVFGYSMGAMTGLQLAIRHPSKVNKLVFGSGAYDFEGWQPEFKALIPQQSVEMFMQTPFAKEYPKLAANPKGFPELVRKMIALQKEPMAWESDVKALKVPVLIIAGDADGATLEHTVTMFRLLGGGVIGDMGKPLPASRLAILPATAHTAVITQVEMLHSFIEPFLKGETPKGFLESE